MESTVDVSIEQTVSMRIVREMFVVHNKVDTNDISSVVGQVRTNVVSIASADDIYSGVIVEKRKRRRLMYRQCFSEAVVVKIL